MKGHYLNLPSGTAGFHYSMNFCRPDGRPRYRIELYVDGEDKDAAARRLAGLEERRTDIEDRFALPLEWSGSSGAGQAGWHATTPTKSTCTLAIDGTTSAIGHSSTSARSEKRRNPISTHRAKP